MSRVAILLHGGIGGGHFSQGQPPVQDIVERLSRRFDIHVYSFTAPNEHFESKSFRIFYPKESGSRVTRWFWLIRKIFNNHNKYPYDVIYGIWGYPAGSLAVVLARVLGLPSVVHLQGGDAAKLPALKYGVFARPVQAVICRLTYGLSSRLIALSTFQAESLRTNGVGRAPIVVPYGADLEKFYFVPERFTASVVRFLHVGNQTPVKGQDMMLRTFSLVRSSLPARLTIVGDDYYNGQLKAWCKEMDIESDVDFVGPQRHSDMPAFYHNADVLLHTPWFEGQGLVFAEAAACGTLIAGTRVGMLADMGEGRGVIVCTRDAGDLAEKIIRAVNSKDHISKMRNCAHEWVRKKDVTYTATTLVRVLDDLITHGSSKRSEAPAGETQG